MLPDDERHGSERGHRAHRRAGQQPCDPCARARMRAQKARRMEGQKRKVSTVGSRRRVQALQALGWSRQIIARELGYTDNGAIAYLMTADSMLTVTAARIADVYDRLSRTEPTGVGASRARTWASRHGYAPPTAWLNIDDPDEQPDPGYQAYRSHLDNTIDEVVVDRVLAGDFTLARSTTKAEKVAIVAGWRDSGRSLTQLEKATGWQAYRYYEDGAA